MFGVAGDVTLRNPSPLCRFFPVTFIPIGILFEQFSAERIRCELTMNIFSDEGMQILSSSGEGVHFKSDSELHGPLILSVRPQLVFNEQEKGITAPSLRKQDTKQAAERREEKSGSVWPLPRLVINWAAPGPESPLLQHHTLSIPLRPEEILPTSRT